MSQKNDTEVIGAEHDEYHQAAIESQSKPEEYYEQQSVENAESRVPKSSVILSILFLGLAPVSNISCGFIVASATLGFIGNELGNLDKITWMVPAWSIASAVTFSIGGSLSDIFGRRNIILIGQAATLIGSAAVPEILAKKYRPIGLAWIETAICVPWVGVAVLLGNVFAVKATWRWIFYIAIIYAALGLIGTAIFYFPPSRPQKGDSRTRWAQLKQLDYIAFFLFTASLSSFLLGISWAGSAGHEWKSVSVILPIVIGFIGFVSGFIYDFTLRESSGQHIMFPLSLMRRIRKCSMSLVVVFVSGLVYYSMAALLPQATGYIFTSDGIKVGVYLLPNGIGQLLPACIVPLFLPRTKHPKRYIMSAVAAQTVFTSLYAYAIDFHLHAWMAFQFFGQSCFSLLTLTLVLNSGLWVEAHELGVTVGLLGTFRSMGGSVGSTVFSTILRTKVGVELPMRIAAVATAYDYRGDLGQLVSAVAEAGVGAPTALMALDLPPPLLEASLFAFKKAYVVAFRTVFLSTIPFGVIAFIATIFIKDASEMMSNEVSIELEQDIPKRHRMVKQTPL